MKKPVPLLIVCCAFVVCLLGCSGGDEGIKENAANVTKMDTSHGTPPGMRPVNVFGNKSKNASTGNTTGTVK